MLPLVANAAYTISITGVNDTAGNQMAGTVTNTFYHRTGFRRTPPFVVLSDPAPSALEWAQT